MSLLGNLTARLPGVSKPPQVEYFFALNIGPEKLTAGLWTVEEDKFRVISVASENYASTDEITKVTDQLLDIVLGDLPTEPSKILFGVQDSWLVDDDLKDPYLKIIKQLVKDLELTPMAYVATSHALVHFLEKHEGTPITSILVGVGKKFVTVATARAGKLDGSTAIERETNLGQDVEKGILLGVKTDVLPAKILIYGEGDLAKPKSELLSYPWMSKLSFLHFPKIEVLQNYLEITSVALAGAVEINPNVKLDKNATIEEKTKSAQSLLTDMPLTEPKIVESKHKSQTPKISEEDMGFVAGDVTAMQKDVQKAKDEASSVLDQEISGDTVDDERGFEDEEIDYEEQKEDLDESTAFGNEHDNLRMPEDNLPLSRQNTALSEHHDSSGVNKDPLVKKIKMPVIRGKKIWAGLIVFLVALVAAYVLIPKAVVQVYVEPRVLEKETQVVADPTIKELDIEGKKIPAEVVDTQISGSGKGQATGKKQIGDSAKGVATIFNRTSSKRTFNKGTILSGSNGLKFTLDDTVSIASPAADFSDPNFGQWPKVNVSATALEIGPDSNLPSGSKLTLAGFSEDQIVGKAEGNFSGGTSKDVTVVTADDQKRLLADVASQLRQKASEELQNKLNSAGDTGKKVLQETLTEDIIKRTYSKNVNDQASEFSLELTIKYNGTAFAETDLRTTVAKLVGTSIPDDFMLNLADAETQADVSSVDKDGKVTFTARFKAKLMPKIDTEKMRKQIIGKTPTAAADILKTYENVLGSEIRIIPAMPGFLQRLPIYEKNIKVEVGLK